MKKHIQINVEIKYKKEKKRFNLENEEKTGKGILAVIVVG